MKNFKEKLTVNGIFCDIDFEVSEVSKPIHILTVNDLPSVNLAPEFIDDCEFVCSNFLIIQERKHEEMEEEERGN